MKLHKNRKKSISDFAEFLVDEYFPNNKFCIQPSLIADENLITYSYNDYENAFDGLLEYDPSDDSFHVFVNTKKGSEYSKRARFTFAHELGHYFLDEHRNALKQGGITYHPSFIELNSDKLIEREADYFAASILMPKSRFQKDCQGEELSHFFINRLTEKYQTSLLATLLRYVDIGHYSCKLVLANAKKINWTFHSENFPYYNLLHYYDKLPKNTIAKDCLDTNEYGYDPEIVYAGDWFELKKWQDPNERLYEICFPYLKDSVLSLLWIP